MREKPSIDDASILTHLNASYPISVNKAEFLPYGADRNAFAYRVYGDDMSYFLKIRRGIPSQSMVAVPDYLRAVGVPEVVSPMRTNDGKLYLLFGDLSLIVYPFINGESAWEKDLSDEQMHGWGDIMRRIHEANVTPSLKHVVPTEQYISKHDALFKRMNRRIVTGDYQGDIETVLADEWKSKHREIEFVYNRHLALGERIKQQNLQHVICHADSHQANIIIEPEGQIRIVDWDEVVIAPKERDLMFFDVMNPDPDSGFFAGYGTTDINYVAIAYYHYEWVVQEFAEWAAWILNDNSRPQSEKEYALSKFKLLFAEDNVVDVAHQAFDRA